MAGSKMTPPMGSNTTEKKPTSAPPADYSHIFSGREYQLLMHRAMLTQRLVKDPFYVIMNVSTAARLWMLKNLIYVAANMTHQYQMNLMQCFESLRPEDMLHYLHYKNAPSEIVALWRILHPPSLKPLPPPPKLKIKRLPTSKNTKKGVAARNHKG